VPPAPAVLPTLLPLLALLISLVLVGERVRAGTPTGLACASGDEALPSSPAPAALSVLVPSAPASPVIAVHNASATWVGLLLLAFGCGITTLITPAPLAPLASSGAFGSFRLFRAADLAREGCGRASNVLRVCRPREASPEPGSDLRPSVGELIGEPEVGEVLALDLEEPSTLGLGLGLGLG
jgi:hypothetical protein